MENSKGEGKKNTNVLRLPKDGLKANVPITSSEYQNFLDKNRELEELREEKGGLERGDYDAVRKAAKDVSEKAKKILGESKKN